MTANNGHCCFQLLAQELTRLGLPEEAEKVLSAIASGSTGSECLGLVGQAFFNCAPGIQSWLPGRLLSLLHLVSAPLSNPGRATNESAQAIIQHGQVRYNRASP